MARTPAWREARRRLSAPEASRGRPGRLVASLQHADDTLLDVVDNLLYKGVMIDGEVILSLAEVDLVYLRLAVLLSAAERMLGQRNRR
ncbi:MAG TPA: gas vesicle protein [Vicinamibacterales bacterium]|nr:gas vesicle protein [Vicinamibacterales bacterium]